MKKIIEYLQRSLTIITLLPELINGLIGIVESIEKILNVFKRKSKEIK